MLQYPPIEGSRKAPIGQQCISFFKYDGSNLRWEWSPKKGWHKFGTRHHLFDESKEIFGEAIPLFLNGPADHIKNIVLEGNKKCERITAFTEFYGDGSFAGSHIDGEAKQLKLLDVFVFKKGFIPASTFVELFSGHDWTPEVIYEGELTTQFVQDIKEGKYPVVEGVICKGTNFMVKIKTLSYLAKLKEVFADKWENYAE